MANTYRAVSDRAKALFGEAEFEAEFSTPDEWDQIDGGHLEIVPRPYLVLSNNYSAGTRGETVSCALLADHESALIQGGHIERVAPPTKKKG